MQVVATAGGTEPGARQAQPPGRTGFVGIDDQACQAGGAQVGIPRHAVPVEPQAVLGAAAAVFLDQQLVGTGVMTPGHPAGRVARLVAAQAREVVISLHARARVRCLAGGSVSLTIGLLAALLSVTIGTLYGAVAGYVGGTLDAVMMRIVDILYGLPYILLVVLLAVAADSIITDRVASWSEQAQVRRDAWIQDEATRFLAAGGRLVSPQDLAAELASNETLRVRLEREGEQRFPARTLTEMQRAVLDLGTLLLAIGGVSWLTMARVIRGQVLSLKARPFMEAARAMGVPVHRLFLRHLLPNLLGPIIVYTTLTVPQAILQESFLSFLGIGVRPPIPSWGNLAADGLSELNRHKSHWWMLFFPCILLGATLLSLNFVGEGLREAFDPRRARR